MNASNRKIGLGFNQKSALNIQETSQRLLLPLLNRFTNEDITNNMEMVTWLRCIHSAVNHQSAVFASKNHILC